jgi:hypothetical protein
MYLTKKEKERCVMARIQRQGKSYQANFTLKQHGNWKAAMTAAGSWVNNLARNLPPRLTSRGGMTSRNKSGVVGVHLHRQVVSKRIGRKIKKYRYRSWVARWPGCEFRGGVKGSVSQFGKDDAFVLALLSRRMETEDRSRVLDALKAAKDAGEYAQLSRSRSSVA